MKFTAWALLPPIALWIAGIILSGFDAHHPIAYVFAIPGLLWFVGGCIATPVYWIARIVRRASRD